MAKKRAASKRREASRAQVLCFMTALAHAAKEPQSVVEKHLMELLAHVTFNEDRP